MSALAPTQLSPEDTLRLNVLLAGAVEAIRIDEGALTLHALTDRGEARLRLNPTCRADQYLLRVRELLGGHALGSPGGYPVYLKRWTRMGQAGLKNLEALLRLGEPEAVVAVANAPGLTDELARRVWWAMPTMEIARAMLACEAVAAGPMGRVLADFLLEHLAFEESADRNLASIRLVLRHGLADAATRAALWAKARRQPWYYLGFLEATPDALPEPGTPRADFARVQALLAPLAAGGNALAALLVETLDAHGQAWLVALEELLQKPATHHIAYSLLDLTGTRFARARPSGAATAIEDILARAQAELAAGGGTPVGQALAAAPALAAEIEALLVLAQVSQETCMPILTRTTAVGPLMRRKLEPLLAPLAARIAVLRAS